MHENLVIRITDQPWTWFLCDRTGRIAERGQGQPPKDRARVVCVLVDMADCLPLTVDIPVLGASKLQQALPWAIEEQIAGNAEDQHVVAADRDAAGLLRVLVVARERMEGWLAALERAGIRPHRMLPDALCLPVPEKSVHLLPVGNRVLARTGHWEATSLEQDLAGELAGELAAACPEITWHGPEVPDWLAGLATRVHSEPGGAEILIDQALASPVNLLEGAYAPVSARQSRKVWLAAAALAGVFLAGHFVFAAVEHLQLKRQSAQLQTVIEDRYRSAFPEAGRLAAGRERELAERELARLRYGEAAGLIDLLRRTLPVLGGAEATRVRSLDYRDGELEVRLSADGVSDLDQLERRLQGVGLDARVQSASLGPDGADGRLRVREAAQ